MTLLCVGLSHREAPIAVREQIAVPDEQLPARLSALMSLPGVSEAMLLSTCNRVEIFAVARGREPAEEILESLGSVAAPHAVCRFADDALRHLFRVAASLDSMVVGEAQILGQVKEAAATAQQAGALGPELQRVFVATQVSRKIGVAMTNRAEAWMVCGKVRGASWVHLCADNMVPPRKVNLLNRS